MSRLRGAALWLLPPLFCLWVHWYGFRTWFQQDDFAWLGQSLEVNSVSDLWRVLFQPKAQGTVRVWSERAFFLIFYPLFGLDAQPFKIWIYLTQFANLALLGWIARRLTGQWLAALLAPLLWSLAPGLAVPLSWASAYNQVLCGFFLLAALTCLIRAAETGSRRWWIAQWAVFILGFGALEVNVVYPAIAVLYAWLWAKEALRKTVWLWLPSGVYAALHFLLVPKPGGVYARHWDLSMAKTLWVHWQRAWAGNENSLPAHFPAWTLVAFPALAAALLAWALLRRDRTAWFGVLWFVIVLGPLLALRDHPSEYYSGIPSAGLALAIASLIAGTAAIRWAAVAAALVYAVLGFSYVRLSDHWQHQCSLRYRVVVEGLESAHQIHGDKFIFLSGVDSNLFWRCLFDAPFRLFGLRQVYLLPGAEKQIDAHPELGDLTTWVMSRGTAARALMSGRAVVYEEDGARLRNVTRQWVRKASDEWAKEKPRSVDLGSAFFDDLLVSGWYPAESGFRWMARTGSLRLGGPGKPGERLSIKGFCPEQLLGSGNVRLTVKVEGIILDAKVIQKSNLAFEFDWLLPAEVTAKDWILIELSADRSMRPPGDGRDLALAFGTIWLR